MSIGPLDLVSAGFQVVGGVVNYFDAKKDNKAVSINPHGNPCAK